MSEKNGGNAVVILAFLPRKTHIAIQIVLQHWILGLYKVVHAEIGRLLMVIVIADTRHKNRKSSMKIGWVGSSGVNTRNQATQQEII